ncbi:MAG: HD domain-containing protein [Patescibacteria group bacterium]|nr:HD domain-containing protein [Patescibacteria group bacterium]
MKNFPGLFKILELTRSMPQYGYSVAGVSKHDLSDLAQHHYLVAIIDWVLARWLKKSGAKINVEKVLEFALVHDLGELFGGDIAMPYVRANPSARRYAKLFEEQNLKFLSKYFGSDAGYFRKLTDEILDAKSDEALISKMGDYIEVTSYKDYLGRLTVDDVNMAANAMMKKVSKLKDPVAKSALTQFTGHWKKEIAREMGREVFESFKK